MFSTNLDRSIVRRKPEGKTNKKAITLYMNLFYRTYA